MTVPTGPGADPFNYSEDTVSARLSVDVPADALANLSQVNQQAADLRTNMVAVARATGDFAEFLRTLPELLAASSDATERLTGATQSRQGGGATSSRNDSTSTLWNNDTPGTGGGRDSDPASALEELRRTDPRQYANLIAQQRDSSSTERTIHEGGDPVPEPRRQQPSRGEGGGTGPGRRGGGGTGPGRDDSDTSNSPGWVDRAQQYQQRSDRFLDQVINESRSGQNRSFLDSATTGVRGLSSSAQSFQERQEANRARQQAIADDVWARPEEREAARAAAARAGNLGTMGGLAMRGAGVAGVAVGGAMAVQKVGEQYQNYLAQGAQRGGGAAEGVAFEAQVRTMALNPFISLEQSRKIMQSALSQGYTGKEFDTVTDFMADNLKKMNVDVAASTKVLQEQVIKGGQSIESAATDIRTVTQLSANDNAVKTSDQFMQQYQSGAEVALNAGGAGLESSEFGQLTASVFSEDQGMQGFSTTLQTAVQNPITQARIASAFGYTGSAGGALSYALSQPGGAEKVLDVAFEEISRIAQPYIAMMADPQQAWDAVENFRLDMEANGYKPLDWNTAEVLLKKVMDKSLTSEGSAAAQRVNDAAGGGELESPSGGSRAAGLAKGSLGVAQIVGGGVVKGLDWLARLGGGDSNDNPIGRFGNGVYEAGMRNVDEGSSASSTSSTNTRIKDLIDNYGSREVKVLDDQGNESMLTDLLGDEGQQQAIADGRSKIKVPGADGFVSLTDLNKQQDAADLGAGGGGLFDLTDQARELLKLIPVDQLTPTQRAANAGEDGANRNNPAAGQGYGG